MATNGHSAPAPATKAWTTSSTIPLWLSGAEVTTSTTFPVVSPITHATLYTSASASVSDAEAALASCAAALPAWRATKPAFRRDIFLRAADIFTRRKDECFRYMREETGSEATMFEFIYAATVDACKEIAGLVSTVSRGVVPQVAAEGTSAVVYREPYGVVLGIAPW